MTPNEIKDRWMEICAELQLAKETLKFYAEGGSDGGTKAKHVLTILKPKYAKMDIKGARHDV